MAGSPSHRWGQIIGELLEAAVGPLLADFARDHDLYLDTQGPRSCRDGKTVTWVDGNGNAHDLDYVMERGGSQDRRGTPVAFIETAWRRYTKHSRNKAQEIQGAIVPLAETYRNSAPFKGAILAGEFTDGALTQLRSLGFSILYFPYDMLVSAFAAFEVDASFEEDTPDSHFRKKVSRFRALSAARRKQLAAGLVRSNAAQVQQFIGELTRTILRRIDRVVVLPLHGSLEELPGIAEAIAFIRPYDDQCTGKPIQRYEIQIRYSNGDAIEGKFADKDRAVEFLQGYNPA
jgi:hypothetical protein